MPMFDLRKIDRPVVSEPCVHNPGSDIQRNRTLCCHLENIDEELENQIIKNIFSKKLMVLPVFSL